MPAIKERTTILRGGRIELRHPEIPEGTPVEVTIVLVEPPPIERRRRATLCGKATGCFASVEEADAFVRSERDRWRS